MEKFDFGVYIGRFEPFHVAHLASVNFALEQCETLIVVIGSCNKPRTTKNPWTAAERGAMILDSLTYEQQQRIKFVLANDHLYNDNVWVTSVQRQVSEITTGGTEHASPTIALFGHEKDDSSFYLRIFPQWKFIETDEIKGVKGATEIRELYFRGDAEFRGYLPNAVIHFLVKFRETPEFEKLKEEFHFIESYKEAWRGAPFPPMFVTVDAVVFKSGHVLVVKRKGNPGKGLPALPGGVLTQKETTRAGAIRELREETGIKVPNAQLSSAIVDSHVFDHPGRSLRGRTITHAFAIDLGTGELPRVRGSDDAEKAWWMPLNEVFASESSFFEDHFHIITHFAQKF